VMFTSSHMSVMFTSSHMSVMFTSSHMSVMFSGGNWLIFQSILSLTDSAIVHCVSKKCANLSLSELCQISTNFDNFWHEDGKEANIMRVALIFHLT